ncbi:MAG TPA: tetratricopeptide repeat protein [Polyangiaceae bacterium]|nr:tetratricopeptide repeat protein [Polyangiaceae bacterium]
MKSVGIRGGLSVLLVALACGCGSSQKEPEQPPPLQQPDEKTAAPSSTKVKQGLEAIRAEKFEEAEKLLSEATQESPEDPQAAFYHGVALDGLQRTEDAVASYQKALKLEPKLTEASQNLSAALLALDRVEDALTVANQGLTQTPEDVGLLANRALALDALGSPDAPAAYEKVLAKKGDDPWLRLNYAVTLARAGKEDQAKAEIAKVPVDEPQLAAQVASFHGDRHDFAACVATLDQAIAKNPLADLFVQRGVCKHGKKDEVGAGQDLKKAVEADPNSAAAHYYLGQHLLAQKKTADAKVHLGTAAELGAGTPLGEKAKQALAKVK